MTWRVIVKLGEGAGRVGGGGEVGWEGRWGWEWGGAVVGSREHGSWGGERGRGAWGGWWGGWVDGRGGVGLDEPKYKIKKSLSTIKSHRYRERNFLPPVIPPIAAHSHTPLVVWPWILSQRIGSAK